MTTVRLLRSPTEQDWLFVKQCTLETVGKHTTTPPTMQMRRNLLESRHSPIRELRFAFEFENLPYWVSTHLVRHVHAQPYVRTQRNDRQTDYDRNSAPQSAPVSMIWTMNAETLMTIANKRLCALASPETRQVVRQMCDLVTAAHPEFHGLLVPMCEYHGGTCHEMFSCGRRPKPTKEV